MKQVYILLTAALVLFLTGIIGCDNPSDDDEDNVIEITQNIDQVTIWYGDKIYIIKAWDFSVQNTLTIQPGTIIKFHPTLGPDLTLGGSGTIIAQGTAQKPIIFTSFLDDAHGGDNNKDGSATHPARKDWGAINTNALNSSVFEYCEFYYGGKSTYNATLELTAGSSNVSVKNCLFVNNDGSYASSAGDIGVLNASDAGTGTVITNNTFYNNVRPLSISDAFSLENSNVFHNPANTADTNTYNAIFVESIDHITRNISWQETEVPFVIDDNDFWIEGGYALTLGNDVVVKFKPASVIVLDDGISAIQNYNGQGVYFTSYKDDSKKGDTNADGTATSPADNDWGGIYDNAASSYCSWSNILYDSH